MDVVITVIAVILVIMLWIMLYDSNRFVVQHYSLRDQRIKKSVKAVVLADLHNKRYGKENERLLQAIDEIGPDMVLIAGDLLTAKPKATLDVAVGFLTELAKKYPVYYGNGNILGYDRYEELLPDKTKLVEFHINPEQAKAVRLIFDMYLDGCGLVKIKDELERRGYKTSQGKEKWFPTVISHVLKNSFYCGIMTYHKEYTPDYLKQKKVKNYGEMEFTQAQGKHEPIVTVEEFERVQRIMELKRTSCRNLNTGPRTKGKKPRTTVWGKLLICECGHTFNMRKWDRSDRQVQNSYQCYSSVRTGSYESRKKRGLPLDGICQTPMIPEWRLQMMANLIFRKYLSQKDKVLALANSILEAHIGDTEEIQNNEELLKSRQAELARLSKKLDGYIEMRSEGDLSREAFRMKCAELEPRMQQLQKEIEKLSAEAAPKEVVDYSEKLTVLQYALEQYTNKDEGQDDPESVIEAFVVKIVVSKDGFDWYLRFDGDPDKPLHCQLQGKRKQTTKIMVSGA